MNTWTPQQILAEGENTDPDLIAARLRKSVVDRLQTEFRAELDQHRHQRGMIYQFSGGIDLRAALRDGKTLELDDVKAAVDHDRDWQLYATQVGGLINEMAVENREDLNTFRAKEGPRLTYLRGRLVEVRDAVRAAGPRAAGATRQRLVDNYAALRRAQMALHTAVTASNSVSPAPVEEARNIVDLFPLYATWVTDGYVVDDTTKVRVPIPTPWPDDLWERLVWFCGEDVDLWVPSAEQARLARSNPAHIREEATADIHNPIGNIPVTSYTDPRTGQTVTLDEATA